MKTSEVLKLLELQRTAITLRSVANQCQTMSDIDLARDAEYAYERELEKLENFQPVTLDNLMESMVRKHGISRVLASLSKTLDTNKLLETVDNLQ